MCIAYKMEYKEEPIVARLRIVKEYILFSKKKKDIATRYSMSRNTVWNIIKLFKEKAPNNYLELLRGNKNFNNLKETFSFLAPKSRKPNSHSKQASKKAEKSIISLFKKHNMWYKRIYTMLKRKWELNKYNLSFYKIKWIYKRNNLKVRKVKTKSWWRVRPIYNYDNIWVFEHIHIDTKHILDKQALPPEIYDKFNLNKELPIYQWTIQCAKSKFRFLLYSNWLNSTYWLYITIFIIMLVRSLWVEYRIYMLTDWWIEFFSNSDKKKAYWNSILWELNAEIDSYNSNKDVRKNIIERSHKTDDEEFYVPRWEFINDKKSFIKEAYLWYRYFNFERGHTGKNMNWKTPIEMVEESWLYYLRPLYRFPTLILEDSISDIMYHTKTIFVKKEINKGTIDNIKDQKDLVDFKYKLNIQNNIYAQNVLDLYHLFFY